MARRKVKRYGMELNSEIAANTACVMGVALFLRIVYFFGLTRLESAGFMHLTFGLILPLLLEAGFIVLIRGVRFDNVGGYILLGAGLCVMLFFQCFRYESILRMVLGFVASLGCGAALIAMLSGMLKEKAVKWVFFGVAALRLFIFNLFQNLLGFHLIALTFEVAAILDLVALGMFTDTLKTKK